MAQTSLTTYIIHPTSAIQESAELALGIFQTFLDRNVSKAFTFHRTNAKARQFQRWADLLINAYWESEVGSSVAAPEVLRVSSAMTASERQRALERSRVARPSILANSRLLATGVDVPTALLCSARGGAANASAPARAPRRAAQALEVLLSDPTALRACVDDGALRGGALELRVDACHATERPVAVSATLVETRAAPPGSRGALLASPSDTAHVSVRHGVTPRDARVGVGGTVTVRRLGSDGGCTATPTWRVSPPGAVERVGGGEAGGEASGEAGGEAGGAVRFRALIAGAASIELSLACTGYSVSETVAVTVVAVDAMRIGALRHVHDGVGVGALAPFVSNAPGLLQYVAPIEFLFNGSATALRYTESVDPVAASASTLGCSVFTNASITASLLFARGAFAAHWGEGAPLCLLTVSADAVVSAGARRVAVTAEWDGDGDGTSDEVADAGVDFEDERLRLAMAHSCVLHSPPPPRFEMCSASAIEPTRSAAAGVGAGAGAVVHTLAQPAAVGQRVVTLVASAANSAPAMRSDDAVRRRFVGSVLRIGVDANAEAHVVVGADVCPGQAGGGRLRVDFHLHAPVAAAHAAGDRAELDVWRASGKSGAGAVSEKVRCSFLLFVHFFVYAHILFCLYYSFFH